MNTLNQSKTSTAPLAGARTQSPNPKATTKKESSYVVLLHGPTTALACNVADRSDVLDVAILGYN